MAWAWHSSFCCYYSMKKLPSFSPLPCASHPCNGNAAHQSQLGQCFLSSSVLHSFQITSFFLPYPLLHHLFFLREWAEVCAQLPELFPRFLLAGTGKMKDRERWGRKYTELICKATLNISSTISSFCIISSPLQSLENCMPVSFKAQEKKNPFLSELWLYLRMDNFPHISGRIPGCFVVSMEAYKKLNRQS